MQLTQLSDPDKSRYNNFVAEHGGSFLQSWDWGQWQEELGHKAHRFFIVDSSGHTILGAQILETKIPKLAKSYLYIPYGPVVAKNLQLTTDNLQLFLGELQKQFSQTIFIRLEPTLLLDSNIAKGLNVKQTPHIQPRKTLVVDLAKEEDELLAAMHPKTRYNIKVAQRHGVEIQKEFAITNGHGFYFEEAINLINQTAKRQSFHTHEAGYYEALFNFFALHNRDSVLRVSLYKALYQKELLTSAIMIDFANTRTYLFGGSSQEQKNVMAPYLLHWQAMLDAKNSGPNAYDFWGVETASGNTPGFVKFKLGFGGQTIEYGSALDIVQKPLWYTIYTFLRKINRLMITKD